MTIQINGTSGISGVDGSAATPALQGTDTNTGISFGTDEVNINTGGTTRATVDSSGRVLVGTSTARGSALEVEGTTYPTGRISVTNNSSTDSNQGAILNLNRTRSDDVGNTDAVSSGDRLGLVIFNGADGSSLASAAYVQAFADGTPSTGQVPGRLVFSTTASGASSPTERMRITKAGTVTIFNSQYLHPETDNAVSLGLSGYRWSSVWAANGTIQTSDQRTKTDIADAQIGSDFIKALRPVSYKWIEGGKVDSGKRDEDGNYIYESVPGTRTHWGFIAQEVKQAVDAAGVDFGGWVLTDKDDPDSQQALRYDQFIAPLTKALQEALAKIETLETANASLETRLTALEGGTNP